MSRKAHIQIDKIHISIMIKKDHKICIIHKKINNFYIKNKVIKQNTNKKRKLYESINKIIK